MNRRKRTAGIKTGNSTDDIPMLSEPARVGRVLFFVFDDEAIKVSCKPFEGCMQVDIETALVFVNMTAERLAALSGPPIDDCIYA